MEEVKLIDAAKLLESEGIFWQWQSGPSPDPWAERDPAKRIWQDYPDNDCRIIEEAFRLQKEIADLKDYEVDLKKMLQVNKKFRDRIRRVRRQEKSRFMLELSEPVVVARDQKTTNDAFGTVQQFLNYIMKRTREAYALYQRLKTLNLNSQNNEFGDIIQEVILCLEKGAEVREKVISTRLGSKKTTFIQDAQIISNLIRSNSTTLEDFLKTMLRIYTEETFICYWLNELLRTENWEEINVLTPYLVCLVYTFKRSEYVLKYEEPEGLKNSFLGLFRKHKLFLYRGTVLSKEHLQIYKEKRIKYFSWNGVTSTSREIKVALNFIQISTSKAQRLKESKFKVLFKIETEVASPEDREGMIDVSSNSKFPEEQEIILAPGTVFEFLKINVIENDIYKINLKITKKFEDTKVSTALIGAKPAFIGALQDQVISQDKAIIKGFPSQQTFKLLEMLKGNKLIQKLEIRDSKIEDHHMEEFESVIATTNVKRENFKLVNNFIKIESLSPYILVLGGVNHLITANEVQFPYIIQAKKDLKEKNEKIKTLTLSIEAFKILTRNLQFEGFMKSMKLLSGLITLDLSISGWYSREDEILEYLKESNSLQTFKFQNYDAISMERLEKLCQVIGSSKTINQVSLNLSLDHKDLQSAGNALALLGSEQNLTLNIGYSCDTPAEELKHLKNCLVSVKSLQSFSLCLGCGYTMTNEKLYDLKSGLESLKSLSSLQSLSFYFTFGSSANISDEGLNNLKSSLTSARSLQKLSLSMKNSPEISDLGLSHVKNGIANLTSLEDLSLSFESCKNISGEGLDRLISFNLTSLKGFSLAFKECEKISDAALCLKMSFISLMSLQHFSLNLSDCKNISDKGLNHLESSLQSLKNLQHLSLDFSRCQKISNEGLNHLSKSLISLTSIQYLSLNFCQCKEISEEGLNHLSKGLLSLKSLQNLTLNCALWKISDEGLNHLNKSLISLTSLHCLSLEFSSCPQISDQTLNHLNKSLLSLTALQRLSLYFGGCPNVSDKGLNHLKSALMSLKFLEYLYLFFPKCNISDNGLNHLKDSLITLTSLQDFSLELWRNEMITDEGLNHLKDCLKPLTSLRNLYLNFNQSPLITAKGLEYLRRSLMYLRSLDHLTIKFNSCSKVPCEALENLKKALSALPHCKVEIQW